MSDIARFVKEKSSLDAVVNVFSAIDEQGSKQIDAEDFRWGLIDLGYNLSKSEAEQVVAHFDKSGSGSLNYLELISKLNVSRCDLEKSNIKFSERWASLFTSSKTNTLTDINWKVKL